MQLQQLPTCVRMTFFGNPDVFIFSYYDNIMKMKKKLRAMIFAFSCLAFCLSVNLLHAATIEDARSRIQTIATYKLILASGNKDYVFTQAESSAIKSMYAELENDTYTVSTRDGSLKMLIDEYNVEDTFWPVNISGVFFDDHVKINKDVELLYSTLMERRYVPEKDMADYQRRDYEYYVMDYESKIRSGETIFYAEIHFKIQRWLKASQYRFVPEELVFYKIAKQDRKIDTIRDLPPVVWSYKPEIEYRTKREIDQDVQKIKQILYAESKGPQEEEQEPYSEKEEYKGRRAIYFTLDTFRNYDDEDDLHSSENSETDLSSFDAVLTFGLGSYAFAGLDLCFDLNEQNQKTVYSFGCLFGANIEVLNFFRPYIQTGAGVRTDDRFVLKAGAGLDIMIGHMLITGSYNYVWNNAFSSDQTKSSDRENKRYNSISVGCGITW